MAEINDTTLLPELLLSILHRSENSDILKTLLKTLLGLIMELEVSQKTCAKRYEHSDERQNSRSGFRQRRFDTRLGTFNLKIPKLREGGYIPAFLEPRKRSEAMLIQVIHEAVINGVSNRKMNKLIKGLGIEGISHGQISNMTDALNEEARAFRERSLHEQAYTFVWVDAVYERIRYDHRIMNMAIGIVCGVNEKGFREIIAIEPMLDESDASYSKLFDSLVSRGLHGVKMVISDAHKGLVKAIGSHFTGASWQRCKVHFMRNVMASIPQRDKKTFGVELKGIWEAFSAQEAIDRAKKLEERYKGRFPKAFETLFSGLEDTLTYYAFPGIDSKRISSTNMIERLNREVRRRSASIGIFPSPESYVKLVTVYLMEYSEDWSMAHSYLNREALKRLLSD